MRALTGAVLVLAGVLLLATALVVHGLAVINDTLAARLPEGAPGSPPYLPVLWLYPLAGGGALAVIGAAVVVWGLVSRQRQEHGHRNRVKELL